MGTVRYCRIKKEHLKKHENEKSHITDLFCNHLDKNTYNNLGGIMMNEKIKVVIDAGHPSKNKPS